MLRKTLVLSLIGTAFLPACNPTNTPGGGQTTTGCSFAGNQAGTGLTINCTVTGGLPNRLIDATNPSNGSCALTSFSLFGQTVNVPVRLIYAENGDDNSGRVRVGAMIPRQNGDPLATQNGSLAKSAGTNCSQTIGPTVAVTTSFGGRHIAIVDKEQTPLCVFQSRLDLAPYNQTIGTGLTLNVSNATQAAVRDEMWRRLDLEIATAVNGLLAPSANLGGAFQTNSGRCANDWQAFSGN